MSEDLQSIHRSLGVIEGKLDGVLSVQTHLQKRLDSYGLDIDRLDRKQSWFAGGLAATFMVVSWVGFKSLTKIF